MGETEKRKLQWENCQAKKLKNSKETIPMGKVQREKFRGKLLKGKSQKEKPNRKISMGHVQRENSKGRIPKENFKLETSKGKRQMGKFQ